MPNLDFDTLLNSSATGNTDVANEMPLYTRASDNHNYGSGDFAITDPTTWSGGVSNAGKFIISAAASGLNSFYNTGAQVGNWLGADIKQNDVAVQLAAVDDDLGKYYQQNRESADMGGFILGALVPGLGGIKVLNAGQKALRTAADTGMIGSNLSRATGLLAPATEAYRTLAATEIAQSGATFAAVQSNTIKAVVAGYGQAALESAAFEIAVGATMFKSPVLEDADGWDIAKNVLVGTAVGGVIGGAINHAVTYGAVKGAAKKLNPLEKQFTDTSDLVGLTPAQQIIERSNRLTNMPEAPTAEALAGSDFQAVQDLMKGLTPAERNVAAGNLSTKLNRMYTEAQTSMQLKNRGSFHALTGGDQELGNTVADISLGLDKNVMANNMEHLTSMGRIGTVLPEEQALNKWNTAVAKSGVDVSLPENKVPFRIGFVKLSGEGKGVVQFDQPVVKNLGDIFANSGDVMREVKRFGFKESKVWNPVEAATSPSGHYEAEARYLWAQTAITKPGMVIGEHDIPLLEKAVVDKVPNIFVSTVKGDAYPIPSADDIYKHLVLSKQEVASELIKSQRAGVGITVPEIAKITNVRASYLEGEIATDSTSDLFARQTAKSEYVRGLQKSGIYTEAKEAAFDTAPTYAKTAYDTKTLQDVDGMQLSGMAYMKAQQKLYQTTIDTAVAKGIGKQELFDRLYHPGDDTMLTANRFDGGQRFFTFANGSYGSVGSWTESVGSTTAAIQKNFHTRTSEQLQAPLFKIASKQDVAIEWSSINKTLQSTSENYGINEAGTALEPLKMLDYKAGIAAGKKNLVAPTMQEGAPLAIPISSADTLEFLSTHARLDSARTGIRQEVRNAQGVEDFKDLRTVRPIRPDPKDFPFYAIVEDPTITGVGHKSMVHATTARDLEAMVAKVPNQYRVYTGDQLKQWHKQHGDFDWSQSLHDNYIDSALQRSGVNNPFFVQTDPQKIAQSALDYHLKGDTSLARELVNAKYEKEFSFLRQQGEQYVSTASSRYGNSVEAVEKSGDNPYTNYIKTALNITQSSHFPGWQSVNQSIDAHVSSTFQRIQDAWGAAKSPADLGEVNDLLTKFGVKTAYYDAATQLIANHTAPRGALVNFVSKANSILSTLVTRTDPFNAINNAVGSSVLYAPEVKSVLRAMGNDSGLAGKLSGLLKGPAPTEAGLQGAASDTMMSAGKVIRTAYKNFNDPTATTLSGVPLKDYYKANGWATSLVDQYHSMLDDVALAGTENVGGLNTKINSAFARAKILGQKAEVYSGNKLSEEMNRFVAADAMRQITDIGVQAGRLTESEATSYINTFVNRTQGNILASQRPLMFQGAIGQAVGMFQSYQFNMMQQLFRHVAEGTAKDSAMLLGMQGTMYGMNGLPAFNFINTHIIGTASGNPQHTDAYSSTYGVFGKSVGDLLLYGLPSNLLRGNLYTRGDINPRQVTIVPTNPADIPFVNATVKMYDNVKNSLARVANGGTVWESMLQGIEHNGLSRPLAGLAQVAQALTNEGKVFSTTSKGTISGANDFLSWGTAVRLAGAKPIDDAIGNDATFRYTVYQAADRNKMDALTQAIKTSVIGSTSPSGDQVEAFSAAYAARGGKQSHFNKYMLKQMKEANTSRANQLMENLKSPYSQKMQQIMGGEEGLDGR